MFLVQNLECVQLSIPADKGRAFFPKDVLKDKHIEHMFFHVPERGFNWLSPFNDVIIASEDTRVNYNTFYLNFFDSDNNLFVKDLNLYLQRISSPCRIYLNRPINFEKSFVVDKSKNEVELLNILLYFSYFKFQPKKFDHEINGSVTITINPTKTIEDFVLSDFIETTFYDKKIKRIVAHNNSDNIVKFGYLDIVGKNGQKISNIPTDFLIKRGPKDIVFDDLTIDFRRSHFKHRAQNLYPDFYPLQLTFIY